MLYMGLYGYSMDYIRYLISDNTIVIYTTAIYTNLDYIEID